METTTLNALWNKILGIFPSKTQVTTALSYKQDKIDSSNKLSGDLIQDGSTNKVINVKPDWNAASGNDAEILNKPTIPSAPGTLNTNNTTAQSVNSSEALTGTVKLHKVSKTGSYNDLLNKPSIPDTSSFIKKPYITETYGSGLVSTPISNSYDTEYYIYRYTDIGTCQFVLQIPSTYYYSRGAMFIIFLGTGSGAPSITFICSGTSASNPPHTTSNNIYYGGSFKSFEANKYYMIRGDWNGYSWILTQYQLYTTPTIEWPTENPAGAYWRSYYSNYNSADYYVLVDSSGKIIKFHNSDNPGSSAEYFIVDTGFNYYDFGGMGSQSDFYDGTLISEFGSVDITYTYNSSTNYTHVFTVDGITYTYTNSAGITELSPTPSIYTSGGGSGLFWRTSLEESHHKLLVNGDGKVVNLKGGTGVLFVNLYNNEIGFDSISSPWTSSINAWGMEDYYATESSVMGEYTYTLTEGGTQYTLVNNTNHSSLNSISPAVTQDYSE